jgi:hypothetical protein
MLPYSEPERWMMTSVRIRLIVDDFEHPRDPR